MKQPNQTVPCLTCSEFDTCFNMKLLAMLIPQKIPISRIHCPKYTIEVGNDKTSKVPEMQEENGSAV